MRAESMKRSSLSTMIARAKEDKVFDEEEAKRGISVARRMLDEEEEAVELLDEEGNVIAGEKVVLHVEESGTAGGEDEFLGPLGKWIFQNMPLGDAEKALGLDAFGTPSVTDVPTLEEESLPARAPKQLLLDLKDIFLQFPGSEKVQLMIGQQLIPLNVTIGLSSAAQEKITAVLQKYENESAQV
jgi:hypothetical protein